MFLRYYTELQIPYAAVYGGAIDQPPEEWLPKLAAEAEASTGRLLLEVGGEFAGRSLRRLGVVRLSRWISTNSGGSVIHITWASEQHPALFPTVDAEFEIEPLGSQRTLLGLSAQYEPPLGLLGRGVDRVLLHRVAEAAAKDFVDSAAGLLNDRVTADSCELGPAAPIRS
jgi:hypothetical protein